MAWIVRLIGIGILFLLLRLVLPGDRWPVALGAAAGTWLLLGFAASKAFEAALSLPFKAKGRVLRGCEVALHAVVPLAGPPPSPPGADDEEDGVDASDPADASRRWFELDVTLRPQAPGERGFRAWDASDLGLVRGGVRHDPRRDDDESCVIRRVRRVEPPASDDEGTSVEGPARLILSVGVAPGVRRLQFTYYFETFGDVALPG